MCSESNQVQKVELAPDHDLHLTEDSVSELSIEVLDDRYELLSLLGEGGMGSVYEARDRQLQKTFAVKLLRPELVPDKWVMKRFEQEIEAQSALDHANLVAIYAHGKSAKGVPYFVMDYVPGESLSSVLKREGHLDITTAFDIFIQICDGLIHAYQRGMIHRDLKPGNILLAKTEAGTNLVKIVDFGIVKIVSEQGQQRLTKTEEVFGSPQYMSPEQCQGDKLDARSDIYSLGCLMYETLSGRAPFAGESPVQVIIQHLNEPPQPLKVPGDDRKLAARLQAIIMRCLEKDPGDRYQSTQELKKDLLLLQSGRRPTFNLYGMGRSLLKGSLWGNLLLCCFVIPAIVGCGFAIAYRHDLNWFLQYQNLTGCFSNASAQDYLALLKVSDQDTAPNVLFKLAGVYRDEAQAQAKDKKDYSKANQQLDLAIALLRRSGKNSGLLAQCLQDRSSNELADEHVDMARKYVEEAMQAAESLNPNGEVEDLRFAGNWYYSSSFDPAVLAGTLENVAQAYDDANQTAKANAAYSRAIQFAGRWDRTSLLNPLGASSNRSLQFAKLLEHYAQFCYGSGNKAKSREMSQRAVEILNKIPNIGPLGSWTAEELENLGELSMQRGDPPVEAERLFRGALNLRTSDFDSQGPLKDYFRLSLSMAHLADALSAEKRYSEAESEYKQSIAMMQKQDPDAVELIAPRFARSYWAQHLYREAIAVLRSGIASNHNADAILHHRPPDKGNYCVPDEEGYQQLADYLLQMENLPEAAAAFEDVVTISQKNGSERLHQAKVLDQYAGILRKLNQNEKTDTLVKQAQELRRADKAGVPTRAQIILSVEAK